MIFNEDGQPIGQLPASGPDDDVTQCTSSTVSVRQGNMINTYAWQGSGAMRHIGGVDVDPVERSRTNPIPSASLSRNTQPPQTTNTKDNNAGIALILFAFVAIILLTPGMSVVAALRVWLSASWDAGKMWMFAVVMSASIWTVFFAISRKWRKATVGYLVLCVGVLGIFAFFHFGLKSRFTREAIQQYFPKSAVRGSH